MHEFDQLHALMRPTTDPTRLDDINALNRMRAMLFVNGDALETITVQTIEEWAHKMFERVRSGSHALGEAIIASGEAADSGDLQGAATEMRRFLETCDMPFYREIAVSRLQEYEAE